MRLAKILTRERKTNVTCELDIFSTGWLLTLKLHTWIILYVAGFPHMWNQIMTHAIRQTRSLTCGNVTQVIQVIGFFFHIWIKNSKWKILHFHMWFRCVNMRSAFFSLVDENFHMWKQYQISDHQRPWNCVKWWCSLLFCTALPIMHKVTTTVTLFSCTGS